MDLIEVVAQAWGWTGIESEEVVGQNDFGNLIVRDRRGTYWRICPEELYCKVVANDRLELEAVSRDQEFLGDWHMSKLVAQARKKLGALQDGRKYCFKIPAVLGGAYEDENLGTIALSELIMFSGDIARQVAQLPDGTRVKLRFTT